VVQEPIRKLVEVWEDRGDPIAEPVLGAEPVARGRPVARGEWQGPLAAPFIYDTSPYAKAWLRHLGNLHPDREAAEIKNAYRLGEPWCRPPGSVPPLDPEDPFGGMTTELDATKKLIYVEHFFEDGRPRVWYKYENGALHRFERDPNGITRSRPNRNLFGKFVKRE
jgi:hypothetical protein